MVQSFSWCHVQAAVQSWCFQTGVLVAGPGFGRLGGTRGGEVQQNVGNCRPLPNNANVWQNPLISKASEGNLSGKTLKPALCLGALVGHKCELPKRRTWNPSNTPTAIHQSAVFGKKPNKPPCRRNALPIALPFWISNVKVANSIAQVARLPPKNQRHISQREKRRPLEPY